MSCYARCPWSIYNSGRTSAHGQAELIGEYKTLLQAPRRYLTQSRKMANRLSRLLVALLFTCLLTVGLGAPTTSSAVPSSTAPSASQASAVLSQNAVSGSNNPVALAINGLIKDAASLARVVASAAAWAQFALIKLFTPELIYSYGKSPPVYPSR